jgi:phosphatidylglycerophosphatase A
LTKKDKIIIFLATGAYSGYTPFAPGTAGTLVAIPLFPLMVFIGPLWGALLLITATAGAIYVSSEAAAIMGEKDPSAIVADEIVGFAFAVYLLPLTVVNLILAFIFFRIFDILKPFPADWADEKLGGGRGIVLDDIVAGIYACTSVHGILWLFST